MFIGCLAKNSLRTEICLMSNHQWVTIPPIFSNREHEMTWLTSHTHSLQVSQSFFYKATLPTTSRTNTRLRSWKGWSGGPEDDPRMTFRTCYSQPHSRHCWGSPLWTELRPGLWNTQCTWNSRGGTSSREPEESDRFERHFQKHDIKIPDTIALEHKL